jgi:hypothetical protein
MAKSKKRKTHDARKKALEGCCPACGKKLECNVPYCNGSVCMIGVVIGTV